MMNLSKVGLLWEDLRRFLGEEGGFEVAWLESSDIASWGGGGENWSSEFSMSWAVRVRGLE